MCAKARMRVIILPSTRLSMDSLEKKTFEVSRGFTYTYCTSPARDALPTIMMFHGWPDTAELWEGVIIDYLKPAGYGVVAVDCLGYAGTSKPTDYKAYNHQHMSKDAMDILDHEKLDKIVSLGHDWGCALAQRLYNYHADRVIGLVMINVSLMEPTPEPFDLDKTIALTKQIFGYGTFVSGFTIFSYQIAAASPSQNQSPPPSSHPPKDSTLNICSGTGKSSAQTTAGNCSTLGSNPCGPSDTASPSPS